MKSVRITKSAAMPIGFLVLATAWVAFAVVPELSSFGLSHYLTAWNASRLAAKIIGFVDSFWGFAAGMAAAAVFGMGWTVVVIKGLLTRLGLRVALRAATAL